MSTHPVPLTRSARGAPTASPLYRRLLCNLPRVENPSSWVLVAPEMELCAPGHGNTGSPQSSQEGIDPEVAVASVKGVARRLKFIVDVLACHIRRCEGRISYEASSSLPGSRTHKGPGSSPAGREPRSLPATPGLQRTSALPTEPSEPRSPRRRPDLPRVLPPREPQLRPRDVYLTTRPRAPGTHTRNP